MALLRQEGLTGSLRGGVGRRFREGPKARVIMIMDHDVPSEEDLKQPYATSVIYIQTPQDHWRMLPADAPLLDRFLVLAPDSGGPGRMGMQAQDVDGSSTEAHAVHPRDSRVNPFKPSVGWSGIAGFPTSRFWRRGLNAASSHDVSRLDQPSVFQADRPTGLKEAGNNKNHPIHRACPSHRVLSPILLSPGTDRQPGV